jgi:hypothetical protein
MGKDIKKLSETLDETPSHFVEMESRYGEMPSRQFEMESLRITLVVKVSFFLLTDLVAGRKCHNHASFYHKIIIGLDEFGYLY